MSVVFVNKKAAPTWKSVIEKNILRKHCCEEAKKFDEKLSEFTGTPGGNEKPCPCPPNSGSDQSA